jgi:hypothetical protein
MPLSGRCKAPPGRLDWSEWRRRGSGRRGKATRVDFLNSDTVQHLIGHYGYGAIFVSYARKRGCPDARGNHPGHRCRGCRHQAHPGHPLGDRRGGGRSNSRRQHRLLGRPGIWRGSSDKMGTSRRAGCPEPNAGPISLRPLWRINRLSRTLRRAAPRLRRAARRRERIIAVAVLRLQRSRRNCMGDDLRIGRVPAWRWYTSHRRAGATATARAASPHGWNGSPSRSERPTARGNGSSAPGLSTVTRLAQHLPLPLYRLLAA